METSFIGNLAANDNGFYTASQAYMKITFYINKIDAYSILTCSLQQVTQYWWLILFRDKLMYCLATQKCGILLFPSLGYLAGLPSTRKNPNCTGMKHSDEVWFGMYCGQAFGVSTAQFMTVSASSDTAVCLIEWLSKIKTDGSAVNNYLIGSQDCRTASCL